MTSYPAWLLALAARVKPLPLARVQALTAPDCFDQAITEQAEALTRAAAQDDSYARRQGFADFEALQAANWTPRKRITRNIQGDRDRGYNVHSKQTENPFTRHDAPWMADGLVC